MDGAIECWGTNSAGQAASPPGTFTKVSAGPNHNCGIRADGTLTCWGGDTYGKATPPSGTFIDVSAGYNYTCAVPSGSCAPLRCWGSHVR